MLLSFAPFTVLFCLCLFDPPFFVVVYSWVVTSGVHGSPNIFFFSVPAPPPTTRPVNFNFHIYQERAGLERRLQRLSSTWGGRGVHFEVGRLRKDNAHGRRSTHLHGIRHVTRRFEIRFAAPPASIPTPLPSMPNWPPPCPAHPPESIHLDGSIFVDHCQCFTTCKSHCITTHHNTPCFLNVARTCLAYVCLLALLCPCAFFGCDLLACMGHLIFSFLCKHTSAALRHVYLCARM